ncbi:MAG: LamG-like jellyroll fold domain-containing protein, partial [Chitinophaga rupis]
MTNPNTMYVVVGLTSNNLWKTTDAGVTWTTITPSTTITGSAVRNISDIAVSDVNPLEIWVTYSGVQNSCQVLHSTDGGATYTNLTTPVLGSFPVTKIIFQRGTDGGVYIGSKSGIYYRNHSMTDWAPLGNGLPRMDIRYLFINYYKGNQGKLLVGTSRGAWDHDLYEHSRTMAQISASTATPSCQTPLVQFRDYSIVSSGGSGVSYSWSFPGGTPAASTLENPIVSYAGAANGSHDVTLTVTDQYGTHTQTLTAFINYDSTTCCQGAPAGWTFTDIGPATTPGILCYTAPTKNFKITSNGAGLSDPNDTVSFVYTALNGDGVITARVKDVTSTYNTNAGIMIRNSLSPNSGYVFLSSLDTRGVFDQWRSSDGAYTNYNAVTSLPMPMWLRLQRKGNNINSFYSGDGLTWTAYNSYTIALGTSVYVGLASSGRGTVTNIDSVNIGPIPPCTGGSANGCPGLDTVPGRAISFYDYTYFHLPFAAPATNTFTITGWIKPNGLQPSQAGIVAWDNGYFFLSQNNDNQLGYDWNGNTATDAWQSGLFVPTGKWSFVAMVIHPDSASFYLNDKQATHITPQDASAITSPVLGNSNQGAGYYTGLMHELTIWNRALSTDEIDSLRHLTKENIVDKTLPGYDPSLIGYFQFNDSNSTSGYNIIDSSSFIFSSGANKTVSTAPVGAGNSGKSNISGPGTYSFGNTGVTITLPVSGVYPNGKVWVTRIGQQPDVVPKASVSSHAYWMIDNYGIDSAFSTLTSLEIDKAIDLSATDAATPGNFSLLRRDEGMDGNTWGSPLNNATAATAGSPGNLLFAPANITSSGQVIVSRGFIPPPAVDTVPGKALALNGYPDKMLMNDMTVNSTNTFTITGWIKPTGTQNPY